MKRSQTIGLIILSITLTVSYLEPSLFIHANAAPQVRKQPHKKSARFTPSGVGAPKNRFAAATRGQCESGRPVTVQKGQETRLIALVPENELDLTTAKSPAIAFYMPPTCAQTMRFSLFDPKTKKAYETFLATPNSSGIINLKLSSLKDFPILEVGQKYQWELSLVIDARDPSADASVNGFIQLSNNKPDPSFWLDTVALLLADRQANPQNAELKMDWKNLMELVGLGMISNESLISNFTVKSVTPKATNVSF